MNTANTAGLPGADEYADLVALARTRVPAHALGYALGGAGDEGTTERNIRALDAHTFTPRMLPGIAAPRLETDVVGGRIAAPLLVAPMGLQGLLDPEAEAATAAAATAAGLGFCLSTFSSRTPADVAGASGSGLRWFQLYVLRDPGLTRHLTDTAAEQGFRALVCTLDVPRVGRRSRDLAHDFNRFRAAPPALVASRPFQALMADTGLDAEKQLARVFPHPECGWDDIARLIADAPLPVLVKGVLHPEDARRAVGLGAAGVVVSNHGGRQFERSITTAEALPRVREALGPDIPVYFDSGIRRPSHAAAALHLGADAALLGRPVLMALAAGGRARVERYLLDFTAQLRALLHIVGAATPGRLRDAEFQPVRRNGD